VLGVGWRRRRRRRRRIVVHLENEVTVIRI
jgi:hypothetical protein